MPNGWSGNNCNNCQHIIHISKNLVKKKKYCILDQLKILKNKFILEKSYLIKVIRKLFWLKKVIQNLKLQLISNQGTTHLLSINIPNKNSLNRSNENYPKKTTQRKNSPIKTTPIILVPRIIDKMKTSLVQTTQ